MAYLRNAWYTAAWSKESTAETPLPRVILDIPIVLFRDSDGQAVALEDTCPHRSAPLSMGKINDGVLTCPYHGLGFNGQGQCVHNPHTENKTLPHARVRNFPTLERYNAIWIWMGDPEQADPALLPTFDFMDTNTHYCGSAYLHIKGNYELESDNILDLSHIEFMHPIFSSPAVSKAKPTFEKVGNTVWSKRNILSDEHAPPFIHEAFQIPEDVTAIDRWLDVRWDAPALLALWAGGVPAGQSKENALIGPSVHWFTPETEKTSHYFFAMGFPKSMGEIAKTLAEEQTTALNNPFEYEDKPIIEAQQKRLGDNDLSNTSKIHLPGDAAAITARRTLQSLISKEQEQEQTME